MVLECGAFAGHPHGGEVGGADRVEHGDGVPSHQGQSAPAAVAGLPADREETGAGVYPAAADPKKPTHAGTQAEAGAAAPARACISASARRVSQACHADI